MRKAEMLVNMVYKVPCGEKDETVVATVPHEMDSVLLHLSA